VFAFWARGTDHRYLGDTRARSSEAVGAALGTVTAITTAGYLLCFGAATAFGTRNAVVLALLFWSAAFNCLITVARIRTTPRPNRKWFLSAVFLATMTVAGSVTLAIALPLLGAGVTSTILQLQVFFVAAGAWVFLRERVGVGLLIGGAMAAGGVALYALPGQSSKNLSVIGVGGALASVATFGGMLIWTRAVIKDLDPVSLNAGRLVVATVAMACFPGTMRGALELPWQGWVLAASAAMAGPVVGRLAVMYSLRYISAAKAKLWSMLSPVFAFLFVYFIYGKAPDSREVLGGLLIVSGVLLPSLAKLRSSN
tara:strand:+ start:38026 stop:38961 length:936 start_codon:yes stop_codon:yes gene_type:complete